MDNFLLNYKPKVDGAASDFSDQIIKKYVTPTPWVEKYRPKTISEVAHQEEVISMLKKCMSGSDFPNLLFYGPPGTGKTSTILAAAKDLFGKEFFSDRVLELNASDERGINVIREKVKNFSRFTAQGSSKDTSKVNSVPHFKLIILDEADNMTHSAQAALRRTMEVECKSTRFCLVCNYITRIIDPITSRCAKFRFKPLDSAAAIERLRFIASQEQLTVTEKLLSRLVDLSEGDLRRAITMLQSATLLATADEIYERHLEEIAGTVPQNLMDELMTVIGGTSYEKTQQTVKKIMAQGYPVSQVISQWQNLLLANDYTETTKALILEKLSVSEEQLMSGADGYLQLMSLSYFVMKQISA